MVLLFYVSLGYIYVIGYIIELLFINFQCGLPLGESYQALINAFFVYILIIEP